MYKISVIIPNYNRNDLLLDTLNSVLSQTINLDFLDIIVVDDCSEKENPQDIIDKFHPRVKLVRNDINLGQVKNLNKCIELASSDLIHILHSDDLISNYFYERVLKAFDNKDVNVVFSSSYYINDFGKIIGQNDKLSISEGFISDIKKLLFIEQVIQTPSIVVRSSVYHEFGTFRNDFFMVEDWEMWARISQKYPFWYIPDFLSYYRINSISTSNSNIFNGNFLKDLKKIQNEFYEIHEDSYILNLSREKYAKFFIGNAKKIQGVNNNILHFKYMPNNYLRLKYLYQKVKSWKS